MHSNKKTDTFLIARIYAENNIALKSFLFDRERMNFFWYFFILFYYYYLLFYKLFVSKFVLNYYY